MDFKLLIQKYINYCSEQFTSRSLERYNYLLHVYRDFLYQHNNMNTNTLSPYLSGITPEEVFQSAEYYIDNKPVKSEDTIRLYISVVKDFFRYLNMTNTIHSAKLIESFGLKDDDPDSFNYKFIEFLNYLYLKNKIVKCQEGILPDEVDIKRTIDCCNKNLDLSEIERLPNKKNSHNRFVKALILKLILLTGVTFTPTIKSIKMKDLDLSNGTLKIGQFKIHLPYNLRLQFNDYTKIWGCKTENDPLFLYYNNKAPDQANELVSIISHKVKITSIISFAKYAILEMIDIGLDKDTIKEFTGYGDDVYNPCKEISDLGKLNDKLKYLDSQIKCLPLFDIL